MTCEEQRAELVKALERLVNAVRNDPKNIRLLYAMKADALLAKLKEQS